MNSLFLYDLIVPVYNGLSYVQECLYSILDYTESGAYRLIIVDDASDSRTQEYLRRIAADHPQQITLHRNPENLGFVKSCNLGIALGNAPFVVLVNSDVIVTPGWLERLVACAERDPSIAAVNPFTNHASQINLPLAPGANFFGMDEYLQRHGPTAAADVVTGVGFCLLLRRSALEQVGVFDEIYGRGYCEESDLCMRLTTCGYRTVVAGDVYVYHKGRGTFTDRGERYRHNRALFDSRWLGEYQRQFRAFRRADPLGPTRALFASRQRWNPMPVIWETARAMLAAWRRRAGLDVLRCALRGVLRLPGARRPLATPEYVRQFTRPGRLRVTYLLHNLVVAGGVLSVIQLVNELILLGVEARIVALFEDPAIYDWTPLYSQPLVFRNERELLRNFPDSDITVATLWSTAPWVAELVRRGRTRTAAYFLQDYEPWFFPEAKTTARQRVRATYALIPHRIVKSDWLQEMLASDGYPTQKILLGMNLARFYPRDAVRNRPIVLAMARPHTPRRGFEPTVAALAQVKAARPEVEIVLFGDRFLRKQPIPFPFRDEGVVADQNRLAELYSEATVFIDGSDFQGFGRCGLEAMACGAACVLTHVGGVGEYAQDQSNALLVAPQRPDQFAEAMLRLLDDVELRERLIEAGLETAQRFCHKREGRETLEYFRSLL
ncbi:MAG: glycosyltransferase [Candidatus Competibacteraceae bacterium]|nr:MAG: glycosyltransferase [Candidatus Competibacteraceae bacterium]